MSYRVVGEATELCSCNTPCPCAFGQEPSNGLCQGFVMLDIREGNLNDVDLGGSKAVLVVNIPGVWTAGNWKAALVLDEANGQPKNEALTSILSGQEGGAAADIAGLVGEMVGVMTEPIEMVGSGSNRSVRIGNIVDAAGEVVPGQDPSKSIDIINANYMMVPVSLGKATRVKSDISGISFDHAGSGMWFGPFEMTG